MKTLIRKLFLVLGLLALPTLVQAQFSFTTNSGAITITGYNIAAGLNMVIPAATNGWPVTGIGDDAFVETSITSATIPNSVTSLGDDAFADCASLTNITVDPSNPNYTSLGGVLFDKARATLIQFPGGLGGSYQMTNSVTNIGYDAFYGSSITNIILPSSVTNIGNSAFFDCASLTSATIGTGVISIGDEAFGDCTSLTSVVIPNSVTSIGDQIFVLCTSLTNVTIGNSVNSIGTFAFWACTSLTSVTIGNSVTTIGDHAFFNCLRLTSVTIPKSVTSIEENAFSYCGSLTSAYFQGNAPPNDGTVFTGNPANDPATVYYLYGTTGWGPTFGSAPTILWNPQVHALSFNGGYFGFNLTGPTNATIIVEVCTNLSHAVWLPIATNTFSASGTSTFSDLQSGSYPIRFYRVRSP